MNVDFIKALKELSEQKGIPEEEVVKAIETAIRSAVRKINNNSKQNFRIDVNTKEGTIKVYEQITVVEENVDNEHHLIAIEKAKEIDENVEIGDYFESEVNLDEIARIASSTVKQVVIQRIREAERESLNRAIKNEIGKMHIGKVHRIERDNYFLLIDEKIEAILKPRDRINRERFSINDKVKVIITKIIENPKNASIEVSRVHDELLKQLLELEVPEIREGIVKIVSVARDPGKRAKIAVTSTMSNVDPVGSCVGVRGCRIIPITNELNGERIDVVIYNNDIKEFIINALSPSVISSISIFEESDGRKVARVIVPDNQLSIAIGREGQNVRLASKLVNITIDILSESQYSSSEGSTSVVDDLSEKHFKKAKDSVEES
jgi:N utilization substance protein A